MNAGADHVALCAKMGAAAELRILEGGDTVRFARWFPDSCWQALHPTLARVGTCLRAAAVRPMLIPPSRARAHAHARVGIL